jgi:hypothetical protein
MSSIIGHIHKVEFQLWRKISDWHTRMLKRSLPASIKLLLWLIRQAGYPASDSNTDGTMRLSSIKLSPQESIFDRHFSIGCWKLLSCNIPSLLHVDIHFRVLFLDLRKFENLEYHFLNSPFVSCLQARILPKVTIKKYIYSMSKIMCSITSKYDISGIQSITE